MDIKATISMIYLKPAFTCIPVSSPIVLVAFTVCQSGQFLAVQNTMLDYQVVQRWLQGGSEKHHLKYVHLTPGLELGLKKFPELNTEIFYT